MSDDFHRAKLFRCRAKLSLPVCSPRPESLVSSRLLSERLGKCGKPNCRCTRGELHKSLYLVQSQGGRLRQICVPQALAGARTAGGQRLSQNAGTDRRGFRTGVENDLKKGIANRFSAA